MTDDKLPCASRQGRPQPTHKARKRNPKNEEESRRVDWICHPYTTSMSTDDLHEVPMPSLLSALAVSYLLSCDVDVDTLTEDDAAEALSAPCRTLFGERSVDPRAVVALLRCPESEELFHALTDSITDTFRARLVDAYPGEEVKHLLTVDTIVETGVLTCETFQAEFLREFGSQVSLEEVGCLRMETLDPKSILEIEELFDRVSGLESKKLHDLLLRTLMTCPSWPDDHVILAASRLLCRRVIVFRTGDGPICGGQQRGPAVYLVRRDDGSYSAARCRAAAPLARQSAAEDDDDDIGMASLFEDGFEEARLHPQLTAPTKDTGGASEGVDDSLDHVDEQDGKAAADIMEGPKLESSSNMKGEWFEVKFIALFFLRALNLGRKFKIASNVKPAGKLDDVVFRINIQDQEITFFCQLKHKLNMVLTSENMLLGDKGDFSYMKYYNSFLSIKQNEKISIESCHFLLLTNAPVQNIEMRRTSSPIAEFLPLDDSVSEVKFTLASAAVKRLFNKLKQAESKKQGGPNDRTQTSNEQDLLYFLRRFNLVSNQPNEGMLEDFIKKELRKNKLVKEFGSTDASIDSLYRVFETTMKLWWQSKERDSITENSQILQDALVQLKVETLSSEAERELKLPNHVVFDENATKEIANAYSGDCSLVCVSYEKSSLRISTSKLLQVLGGDYIFVGTRLHPQLVDAVTSVWSRSSKKHVLVIALEADMIDEDVDTICGKLTRVLQEKKEKRIILLFPSGSKSAKKLIEAGLKLTTIEDEFLLSHLSPDTMNFVCGIYVTYQGHVTTLGWLLEGESVQKSILRGEVFENVVTTSPLIVGQELPSRIDFYVERTLITQNSIKNSIFADDNYCGKFEILKGTADDSNHLVPHTEAISIPKTYEFLVSSEDKYVIQTSNVLDNIGTSITSSDLHILQLVDKTLYWKETTVGNIDIIKRHVDLDAAPTVVESPEERVVLLVAEPGMGKTTLLTELVLKAKETCPRDWVVSVSLSRHVAFLSNTKKEDLTPENFLTEVLSISDKESPLSRSLLKYNLYHSGNIVILLDGFDEIAPKYLDECSLLLTRILQTRVKRVWVTSRQPTRDHLETLLSTLAHSLRPFTENDQKQFLASYWRQSLRDTSVHKFITELLDKTKSLTRQGIEFAGIPLQTLMLAEGFQDYISSKKSLPETIDIIQLIKKSVHKKYRVYIDRTFKITENSLGFEILIDDLETQFWKKHKRAALILLFSTAVTDHLSLNLQQLSKKATKFFSNILQGKDKTGIIDYVVNEKPIFVHRVFAEFFSAVWFSQHFRKSRDFLRSHYFSESFAVVRSMLDRLLAEEQRLHQAILSGSIKDTASLLSSGEDVNARDSGGRTALHVAVIAGLVKQTEQEKHEEIMELLLKHNPSFDSEDNLLQFTPVQFVNQQALPNQVECYINRNLTCENVVLPSVFSDANFKGIIVIKLEQHCKIPNSLENVSFRQEENNYIFENVEKMVGRGSVHYLEVYNDLLIWKKTEGDVRNIKKHIASDTSNPVSPDAAVVLLVGEPGMGKTAYLNHIAHQSLTTHPKRWVRLVDLGKHGGTLAESAARETSSKDLVEAALCVEMPQAVKSILKHSMRHSPELLLLFDGFDEVSPTHHTNLFLFLSKIAKTPGVHIWVSSRLSSKTILEIKLSTFAVTLVKLSAEDQRCFLVKYLANKLSTMQINSIIDQQIENKNNQFMRELTGIPLVTKLLADEYVNSLTKEFSSSTIHMTLYKLVCYYVSERTRLAVGTGEVVEESQPRLLELHGLIALTILLDSSDLQSLQDFDTSERDNFMKDTKNGTEIDCGFFHFDDDGQPVFEHRVLAVYFAAEWLFRHFDVNREFIRKAVFDDKYRDLYDMFSRILSEDCALHLAVLDEDHDRLRCLLESGVNVNEVDKGGRTALHLAMAKNNSLLSYILVKFLPNSTIRDHILGWTPSEYRPLGDFVFQLNSFTKIGNIVDSSERLLDENSQPGRIVAQVKPEVRLPPNIIRAQMSNLAYDGAAGRIDTYRRTPGVASNQGFDFQLKVAALLFLRLKNKDLDFQLASNVRDADYFDDIVFRVKSSEGWQTCFIKVRLSKNAKFRKGMLLGERGDYSLHKMLNSIVRTKRVMDEEGDGGIMMDGDFDRACFTFYSNQKVDATREQWDDVRSSQDGACWVDDYLQSGTDDEFIFNFVETGWSDVHSYLEKRNIKGREFLSRIRFFTSEPDVKMINDDIKSELLTNCRKYEKEYNQIVFAKFLLSMKKWYESVVGVILDQNSVIYDDSLDVFGDM